jgi:hypothetical protein
MADDYRSVRLRQIIGQVKEVLSKPALSGEDPQRLLIEVVRALELLDSRVKKLEDESEAGRRATMGLR